MQMPAAAKIEFGGKPLNNACPPAKATSDRRRHAFDERGPPAAPRTPRKPASARALEICRDLRGGRVGQLPATPLPAGGLSAGAKK